MDYSKYQNIRRGEIENDIKIGLPYGDMPPEALMSKFDETSDIYTDCDTMYDFYARETLTDRRPDDPTFAYEEPRQSISNKGYLNLIHYGTRSGSQVAHPEIFLGLTEGEPRGIATDPDYKELRKQHEARNRFKFLGPDADNSITGGGWNEAQVQESKQKTFKEMKPRLRIFSTGKDGRREGIRRMYQCVSDMQNITDEKKYGDVIKDWAVNPQRNTVILSNKTIRNSKMYQQFTTDHEFQIAHYGDACRKRNYFNRHQALTDVEADYEFNEQDMSKCFKAVGVLMGQACKNTTPDMDYGEHTLTQTRKQAVFEADIVKILDAITNDADFHDQDKTIQSKTAPRKQPKHGKLTTDANHTTPANVLINGMLMSKGVKESSDLSKIRKNMVTTPNDPNINCKIDDINSGNKGKTKHPTIITGKRHSEIIVDGESVMVPHYKSCKPLGNTKRKQNTSHDGEYQQSTNTQTRRTSTTQYRNPSAYDNNHDMQFSTNTYKDRHIAPMGNKYTMREVDTDTRSNCISNMS